MTRRTESVEAVLRACLIMELFNDEVSELTVADVVQATGLNRTTVYRLLNTLVEARWLERRPNGRFSVTWKVFRIGASAYELDDLKSVVRPVLAHLAKEFGDTAYFMVPSESGVICIDLAQGSSPLQVVSLRVGSTLPFNAGAASLAMVAFSEELRSRASSSELVQLTDRTIATIAELEESVAATRTRGFSLSENDVNFGVSAVGAAIQSGGIVVGSISLGGSTQRFQDLQVELKGEAVVNAAAEVSNHLTLGKPL